MSANADQETAAAAVLVKSEEMPADAQKVEELDFNKFKGKQVTVEDLIGGMTNMGFQASSIGEAVKIINDMVRHVYHSHLNCLLASFSASTILVSLFLVLSI